MIDKFDYASLGSAPSVKRPSHRSRAWLLVGLAGMVLFLVSAAWYAYYPRPSWNCGLGPPTPPPLAIPPPPAADDAEFVPVCGGERTYHVAVHFFKNGKSDEMDRFGIHLPHLGDDFCPEGEKRLFSDPHGLGNNTILDVNGYQFVFGDKYAAAQWMKDPESKAILRDQPLTGGKSKYGGWQSSIQYRAETALVEVTRKIQIVEGVGSYHLNTVHVTYCIRNVGNSDCAVALRTKLDTQIGFRDDVPFYVPRVGEKPGCFVDQGTTLHDREIPDYIQALESDNLTDWSSVNAVLRFHPEGVEVPEKVVIGPPADGKPVDPPQASGVTIFWARTNLQPNSRRVVGYTYGLGPMYDPNDSDHQVAVAGDKQLGLQIVNPHPKKPFLVTAFVRGNQNQKVTLTVPSSAELEEGESAEKTAVGTDELAVVSWRVRLLQDGKPCFVAEAADIGRATATIEKLEKRGGCNLGN